MGFFRHVSLFTPNCFVVLSVLRLKMLFVLSFILFAGVASAASCQHTMEKGENLFTVAELYGSDWLTLWSMNHQDGAGDNDAGDHPYDGENPDWDQVGQKVYFAHPYEVAAGETTSEIARRFGISLDRLVELNSAKISDDPNDVQAGTVLCIIPTWQETIDRMGKKVCGGM